MLKTADTKLDKTNFTVNVLHNHDAARNRGHHAAQIPLTGRIVTVKHIYQSMLKTADTQLDKTNCTVNVLHSHDAVRN